MRSRSQFNMVSEICASRLGIERGVARCRGRSLARQFAANFRARPSKTARTSACSLVHAAGQGIFLGQGGGRRRRRLRRGRRLFVGRLLTSGRFSHRFFGGRRLGSGLRGSASAALVSAAGLALSSLASASSATARQELSSSESGLPVDFFSSGFAAGLSSALAAGLSSVLAAGLSSDLARPYSLGRLALGLVGGPRPACFSGSSRSNSSVPWYW